MRIAIVGWGSLIPNPRGLPIDGSWQEDGPALPIEFSRISQDGRLTLVIDCDRGTEVRTYHVRSLRAELNDAICDLMVREGTDRKNIGICSTNIEQDHCENHPAILPILHAWLKGTEFDVVIWTDLKSNFKKKRARDFEEGDALSYLNSLPPVCKANAHDYIVQAPPQTQTKLRKYLQSKGWL
jgi:hypothetical protein